MTDANIRPRRAAALGLALLTLLTALYTLPPAGLPEPGRGSGGGQNLNVSVSAVSKTFDVARSIEGVTGIDVSQYQGNINWAQVAQDDIGFVMARASIGDEIDATFVTNATGAYQNGLKVGAYHYAKFTDEASMRREVGAFLYQLRQVHINYPVALDIEAHRGLGRAELTRLALAFAAEIEAEGYDVMIYSYSNFFRDYLDIRALSDHKLWIANYAAEPAMGQAVWQYTSYGSVHGINGRVDLNVTYDNWGEGYRRSIRVDSNVSRAIKEALNEHYGAGLDVNELDMDEMNAAVSRALHTEINYQFGVDIGVSDEMTQTALSYLTGINYAMGRTRGNITYLYQVKLFYKGFFHKAMTAVYDDATALAIYEFQLANGLEPNGIINAETLRLLLR